MPASARKGYWLRIARLSQGLSQRELSERSGVTQAAISHIEQGDTNPWLSTERKLACALDYTTNELFPRGGKPSPSKELRRIAERGRPW